MTSSSGPAPTLAPDRGAPDGRPEPGIARGAFGTSAGVVGLAATLALLAPLALALALRRRGRVSVPSVPAAPSPGPSSHRRPRS